MDDFKGVIYTKFGENIIAFLIIFFGFVILAIPMGVIFLIRLFFKKNKINDGNIK